MHGSADPPTCRLVPLLTLARPRHLDDDFVVDRAAAGHSMAHGQNNFLELPLQETVPGNACDRVQAFDAFLHDQHGGLLQFLRMRTPSEEDAKDAAQESLMRLLRYRETEPESSWKPLLYRIAINVVSEQFRRNGARQSGKHVPLEGLELPSQAPLQEEMIARAQGEAWLRAAILALPTRCRQVYLLSRMQGMTYPQIAQHCGISVKTVEKHISQALATLCDRAGVGDADAL